MEVVTGVTGLRARRARTPAQGGTGNPLMPERGGVQARRRTGR